MNWLTSNIDYSKNLVGSGVDGARSVGRNMLHGEHVETVLSRSARNSWPSIAIGAGLGILCGCLATRRKIKYEKVFACGLLGGAVGLSTGLAWETRRLTGGMARGAIRNLGEARNAHWLARHPINYG